MGASSEQATEQLVGQMSFLFNEAEEWAHKEESSVESTTVSAHTRKRHTGNLDSVLPEGIEFAPVPVKSQKKSIGNPEFWRPANRVINRKGQNCKDGCILFNQKL